MERENIWLRVDSVNITCDDSVCDVGRNYNTIGVVALDDIEKGSWFIGADIAINRDFSVIMYLTNPYTAAEELSVSELLAIVQNKLKERGARD